MTLILLLLVVLFIFFLKIKEYYLSGLKGLTTEHEKHWTSFTDISPTAGFSSGW